MANDGLERLLANSEYPEIRHLRYFVTAAEHGSFRKASQTLGIQESAVSRRIRDLEDHLGASLFQRQASGVTCGTSLTASADS